MTEQTAVCVTQALVVLTPVVWLLWDAYAYLRFGDDATESHFVWTVYEKRHWFALVVMLALAALCWHFWLE